MSLLLPSREFFFLLRVRMATSRLLSKTFGKSHCRWTREPGDRLWEPITVRMQTGRPVALVTRIVRTSAFG